MNQGTLLLNNSAGNSIPVNLNLTVGSNDGGVTSRHVQRVQIVNGLFQNGASGLLDSYNTIIEGACRLFAPVHVSGQGMSAVFERIS